MAKTEEEQLLEQMEKKVRKVYKQAYKDASIKLGSYLQKFEKDDKKMKEKVESGEIEQKDYEAWRMDTIVQAKQYDAMLNRIGEDLVNSDKIASGIINDNLPDAYANGRNRSIFDVSKAIGYDFDKTFSIYNKHAVQRLLKDDDSIFPKSQIDTRKDRSVIRQRLHNAVTQGIIKGDSMDKVAQNMQSVTGMSYNSAMRAARTLTGSAQNLGTLDGFHEAEDKGVKLQKQWLASLDRKTRDSHRDMDGITIGLDEKFPNGCKCPLDPDADASEVINCRCTMIAVPDGFQYDMTDRWSKLPSNMTYEDWKNEHKNTELAPQKVEDKYSISKAPVGTIFNNYGGLTKQSEYTDYHGTRASNRINTKLRQGEELSEDDKKRVSVMDSKMEPVKSPILAYRQVNANTLKDMGVQLPDLTDLKGHDFQKAIMDTINDISGSSVVDKGFMSATYSGDHEVTGVWMNIVAEKGTPAFLTSNDDEYEITFGRDLDVKFVDAHFETKKNHWGREEEGLVIDVIVSRRKR